MSHKTQKNVMTFRSNLKHVHTHIICLLVSFREKKYHPFVGKQTNERVITLEPPMK